MVSGSNPECHPGTDLLVAVDNLTVRSEEQRWALAKKRLDLLFKQVEFIDTTQQHVKVAQMWHEQVPSMGVVSELFNEKHHNDIVWDDEFLQSPDLDNSLLEQLALGVGGENTKCTVELDSKISKDSAHVLLDGMPHQDVVWDVELLQSIDSQDGLLQQLAHGVDDQIQSKNVYPMLFESDAGLEYDEMLDKVVWDEEMSAELNMNNNLLQLLASSGGYPDDEQVVDGSLGFLEFELADAYHIFVEELGEDSKSVSEAGMDDELTSEREAPFLLELDMYYADKMPTSLGMHENLPSALEAHDRLLQQLAWDREDFDYEMGKAIAELVLEYVCTNVGSSSLSIDSGMQLIESFVDIYLLEVKDKRVCISMRQWDPGIFSYLTMGLASRMGERSALLQFIQRVSEVDKCGIVASVLEQDVMLKIRQMHGNETTAVLSETILTLLWAPSVISWHTMLEYHTFMCQMLRDFDMPISDEAFKLPLLVGAYLIYENYKGAAIFVKKLWDPGI